MDKILNKIKKIIPLKLFKLVQPAYHYVLSAVSAMLSGFPSEKLIVIGVTGTTGKTTCVFMIAKLLENAGYKTGYTSTAMFNDGKKEWLNDKKMTMPGRFFTQNILKQMVKNGCKYAIIETTSEGIKQFRHKFINYDVLVFTGLYPEHIESHGGFENYKKAKGKLFAHLKNCHPKYADEKKNICLAPSGLKKVNLERIKKTFVINKDDANADYFLSFWAERKIIFGSAEKKTKLKSGEELIEFNNLKTNAKGISFNIGAQNFQLSLFGEFNAWNAMSAVGVLASQSFSLESANKGFEQIKGIPGRLEKIEAGQDFTAIVDYAFEPKAVAKLYETVEMMPHKKIIHLLGSAGGGRDAARRPKLGALAARNADYIIVSNEDPYDENPQTIIDQVAAGSLNAGKKLNENLFKILDRRQAIKKALELAAPGDIVLITGKGSEQAICAANGEKIPWDDRLVVKEELKQLKV